MLKTRLIPVLLLKNGVLVRSETFSVHQTIGYPINEVQRFAEWNVDELIYLDISRDDSYDVGRDDHKVANVTSVLDILDAVADHSFMPLTFGGRIRSIADVSERLRRGADKVSMNTAAVSNPALVTQASSQFGAQAIVVGIDVRRDEQGRAEVVIDGGRQLTGLAPEEWAAEAERLGAGEILLQSVDRDGTGEGYDLDLIESVSSSVSVPVIALGGAGDYDDYVDAVESGASAVAAANIFHFKELSDRNAKRAMDRAGIAVRW